MVALQPNFELSEETLRSRFETIQPEIRERIELSCSTKGVNTGASVESAVEEAYNLFVQLARKASIDLAYPTPLALAALRLDQQKRRSRE
jgi:hypothetical protein